MKTITILLLLTSLSFAQTEIDSVNQIVDSLFIRATTKNINFQDQVKSAKEALVEMGESAVPRLVQKMNTQDARSMLALVDIFKLIGSPAVPHVVEALGHNDPFKRRLAARTLGEMKDSTAVDGLLRYNNDPDFRIRAGVIVALGKIGDPGGIETAVNGLGDQDYLVRLDAATALSMFADSSTIDVLLKTLSDPYYGVRYKAAEALANIGEPAVEPVLKALKSKNDNTVFYLLIEISGNLKDEKLIQPLSDILKTKDPIARAVAVEALGKFQSKNARETIQKLGKTETHPLVIGKLNLINSE